MWVLFLTLNHVEVPMFVVKIVNPGKAFWGNHGVHCALLWCSSKSSKGLIFSCSFSQDERKEQLGWFLTVAEELNSPSLPPEFKRLMLRAIQETLQRAREIRRRSRVISDCVPHAREAPFSFDRSPPGRGGTGVDDGDGGY